MIFIMKLLLIKFLDT